MKDEEAVIAVLVVACFYCCALMACLGCFDPKEINCKQDTRRDYSSNTYDV